MRSGLLLSASVFMVALGVAPAHADAITDPAAVNYEAAAASLPGGIGSALFDADGTPFLLTSPGTYLQLSSRGKLRGGGDNDEEGGIVGSFVSAGLSSDSGAGSGGGSGAGGNGDGDNGDDPGAAFIPADSGGSNEGGRQIDDNGPAQVPEPASVLLFGPAALFALRRRNRVN